MECPFYHPKVRTLIFPKMNLVVTSQFWACKVTSKLYCLPSPIPQCLTFLLEFMLRFLRSLSYSLVVPEPASGPLGQAVWTDLMSVASSLRRMKLTFAGHFPFFFAPVCVPPPAALMPELRWWNPVVLNDTIHTSTMVLIVWVLKIGWCGSSCLVAQHESSSLWNSSLETVRKAFTSPTAVGHRWG